MLGSICADLAPHPSPSSTKPPGQYASRLCAAGPGATEQHLRRVLEHAVAPTFAVGHAALWSATRGSPREAFARQVAMYLAHVGLGLSLKRVGRLFARDRRTVAHACALVEDRRDARSFDRALDLLEGALHLVALRKA